MENLKYVASNAFQLISLLEGASFQRAQRTAMLVCSLSDWLNSSTGRIMMTKSAVRLCAPSSLGVPHASLAVKVELIEMYSNGSSVVISNVDTIDSHRMQCWQWTVGTMTDQTVRNKIASQSPWTVSSKLVPFDFYLIWISNPQKFMEIAISIESNNQRKYISSVWSRTREKLTERQRDREHDVGKYYFCVMCIS